MSRKHQKIEIATPDDVAKYAQAQPEPSATGSPVEPGAEGPGGPLSQGAPSDAGAAEAEALRAEIENWKDKCLRARAEMANYQRRSEQERTESIKYANAQFAKDLLPIVDDLERALGHIGSPDADGDSVVHALRLIYEKFTKALGHHDIEAIDAVGQPFDPALHEAMMQQPSDAHPGPTVLQVFEKGYRMHDRVLRPAKVVVSKPPSEE